MNCPACAAAEANPLYGSFLASCKSCSARMLANSPKAFDAMRNGRPDELQQAISATWPDDYEAGRQLVWQWIQKLSRRTHDR